MFQFFRIEIVPVFILVVEITPRQAFHFASCFREYRLNPFNYGTKIIPEHLCIGIMLMFAHIIFNRFSLCICGPFYYSFQILLPDTRTFQIVPRDLTRRAFCF